MLLILLQYLQTIEKISQGDELKDMCYAFLNKLLDYKLWSLTTTPVKKHTNSIPTETQELQLISAWFVIVLMVHTRLKNSVISRGEIKM
jgi:hypothetical protein